MLRTVLLIFLAVSIQIEAIAQFPSFDSYSVSKILPVFFTVSGTSGKGKIKVEVPPWMISGGWQSYFFVDGSDTYIWSIKSSIADKRSINLKDATGPALASMSYIHSANYNPGSNIENWKRNYHAIYSAVYIKDSLRGPVSLGFLHGENKNQISENNNYQNTIQPNVTINPSDPHSYSGGKPFREGWKAYNAIISGAWIPNNQQTNWGQQFFKNDLGPIAWPSTAYITRNDIKCTSGLKHPSSIIAGNYIYIFYADGGPFGNSIPRGEGRLEGIKVIRAPVADALNAKNYKVYYRDTAGNEFWLPSLPDGFTKENMLNFVSVRGPKSTDIMDDYNDISQEIRFSVARVRNTNYFIGVEEYIDQADARKFKVALRFSNDLIHWTDRSLIVAMADNWNSTRMNYPIFLSKDGQSNTEIDLDDFYILGTETAPGKFVNKIHVLKSSPAARQSASLMAYNQRDVPEIAVYPNPTSGFFQMVYNIEKPSQVRIIIFDIMGRKLATINDEHKKQGKYVENLDIINYPDGVYIIEMLINNRRRIQKLIKIQPN